MTPDELRDFMSRHKLTHYSFATILGVTPQAVINWLEGKRAVSLTVVRLCRMFDKRPESMKEFVA